MAFNVSQFRSNLISDGARPNLFDVSLTFPSIVSDGITSTQKAQFLAKSAQLPGSSIGTVPMYYFGRELKMAGNRTFTDWSVTIINDEDFSIRNSLEIWMGKINSHAGNIRSATANNPTGYSSDSSVTQYGKDGSILKVIKIIGMFPIDISPIDLGWDQNDSIEEYQVTFAYQYWTSDSTDS